MYSPDKMMGSKGPTGLHGPITSTGACFPGRYSPTYRSPEPMARRCMPNPSVWDCGETDQFESKCWKPSVRKAHVFESPCDRKGWNDVGFHGSNSIPTPNMDALAYSGVILNNYYVQYLCTPSRSALLTGRYPIHTGMQHLVLNGDEPRGLPLSEALLPEYLNKLGYQSHIVGKWHLGFYKKEYTPTYRGFESHLGCWWAYIDYNDHTSIARAHPIWGLDMRRNMDVAYDLHGVYATDIYTSEAVKKIQDHNTSSPLFLFVAHNAVHSGNNYNPLAVADKLVQKMPETITDYNRRRFAALTYSLDQSIGNITRALFDKGMLNNSIIIFSSDNGGPSEGYDNNFASNFPLRGMKNTFWEGGVKGAGFIWSPLINKAKRVSKNMMHITDWLPTLYSAAGGDVKDLKNLDGYDLWESIVNDKASLRNSTLLNIDDISGNAALIDGEWKIVKGPNDIDKDDWYGPSERENEYDISAILNSEVGSVLSLLQIDTFKEDVLKIRNISTISCPNNEEIPCNSKEKACIFNIKNDPCEKQNLADRFPEKLKELEWKLDVINKTAVPAGNLRGAEEGNPKYWNYVWTNFGDFTSSSSSSCSYSFQMLATKMAIIILLIAALNS